MNYPVALGTHSLIIVIRRDRPNLVYRHTMEYYSVIERKPTR